MTAANPYEYTDQGATWQQGYDTALSSPGAIVPAPYVIAPGLVPIWDEGAIAGNSDGQVEGWRVRLEFDGSGFQPSHPHYAAAGLHAGEIVLDTVLHGVKGGVGSLPLLGLLIAIDLESFDPTSEQALALAGKTLTGACARIAWSEIFMGACGEPGHRDRGDPMLDAGYWHGGVFSSYEGASGDCDVHVEQHGHEAGVIRYQPNSDNLWEWIEAA